MCLCYDMRETVSQALDVESGETCWQDFVSAINTAVYCSCCGGAHAGTVMAARRKQRHPIMAQGRDAWVASIGPADPILHWRSGSYILPSVTIAVPGGPMGPPVDIEIRDGRIGRIGPAGELPASPFPIIEQLRGHFVAPGLIDMHVHMPADNAFRLTHLFMLLQLRHGVVRVRDAGDPDGTATPAALRALASGALPGPDISYAYAFVGAGTARWGNSIQMDSADQAEAIVATLAATGARWIKSYENLDAERIAALVRAAEAHGMQVMGHVPSHMRLEDARIPDSQHGFGVPDPRTVRLDHVLNRAIDWGSVHNDRIANVVDACVEHGLAMTPTISTSINLARLQHWEKARHEPDVALLPSIYPDIIWHPRHGLPAFRDICAEDFDRARDALERKYHLVGAAFKAGVPLRLGTDTQQPFVVPGCALHREIAAFEEAGINRAEAWRLAGLEAQKCFADPQSHIAEGQRADLLIAPTMPFAQGWSPDAISATITNGACLLASDMDAAIAREQQRHKGFFKEHVARWLARFALDRTAKNFRG
jgi:hypothetical protein